MRIAMVRRCGGALTGRDLWARSLEALSRGLSALGVEIESFDADDGGGSPAATEAEALSRAVSRGAEFDLIHCHNPCAAPSFAAFSRVPFLLTLYGPPEGPCAHVSEDPSGRSLLLSGSDGARQPGLAYAATLPPAVEDDGGEGMPPVSPSHVLVFSPDEAGIEASLAAAREAGLSVVLAGPARDGASLETGGEPHGTLTARALAVLHLAAGEPVFPLPLLYAQAAGTPVVALRGSHAAEVVEDGVSGLLIGDVREAADALAAAVRLDRAACRASVLSRHGPERAARAHLGFYEAVLLRLRPSALIGRPPWGVWTVLEDLPAYKVKRVEVFPGKRISYQRHERRREHWIIVAGQAVVTLDGERIPLSPGQAIDVPLGAAHRIENPGDSLLTFIEVQEGDYFGEDDILRLDDDYGRTGTT